jgi:hypothetical protein
MLQSYDDTSRNRRESGWTFSLRYADELFGNLAEGSNENAGLRAITSNIQPKFVELNVRHHFHVLTHFDST